MENYNTGSVSYVLYVDILIMLKLHKNIKFGPGQHISDVMTILQYKVAPLRFLCYFALLFEILEFGKSRTLYLQ